MTWSLALLITAALIAGISKTSFGGMGAVAVALLALSMPTKESTAAALLLLIVGDVVAVARYRRSARWELLRRLLPAVIPGLIFGALFIHFVDDLILKRTIGAILAVSVVIHMLLARRRVAAPERAPWGLTLGAGMAAGFTTMTANAAGPVMALYLQLARVDKLAFLGTFGWFFFIINVAKTPFTAALGLFTPEVMRSVAIGTPFVLLGTVVGIQLIKHVSQQVFDRVTLITSLVAALALLVL